MGWTRLCRTSAAATVLSTTLIVAVASANPSDAELKAARKAFARAEQDEDAGRWSDALAKLRDISHVKLTAGVRYHIALCEQNLGQLANALQEYTLAETQSRAEDARDVLPLVGKRLEELGARVPRLAVRLVPPRADAILTLDGKVLTAAEAAAGVPVDPGSHHLEASAPGAAPAVLTVTLSEREGSVAELRLDAKAPPAALLAPTASTRASTPPTLPFPTGRNHHGGAIALTAGAVALAAGGVAAFLLAGSAHERGLTACAAVVSRAPDACGDEKSSVRRWDFAAASAWASAVAAGTVAVFLWTKPLRDATSGVGARLGVGPGSLELEGHF